MSRVAFGVLIIFIMTFILPTSAIADELKTYCYSYDKRAEKEGNSYSFDIYVGSEKSSLLLPSQPVINFVSQQQNLDSSLSDLGIDGEMYFIFSKVFTKAVSLSFDLNEAFGLDSFKKFFVNENKELCNRKGKFVRSFFEFENMEAKKIEVHIYSNMLILFNHNSRNSMIILPFDEGYVQVLIDSKNDGSFSRLRRIYTKS